MTTRDSGSSNLLDEFFAPSKDGPDEEVEVVHDVEDGDDADAAVVANASPRRSLPPPPPSMRGGRAPSAPPPRGRKSVRPSAPPPPPKSTLRGSGSFPIALELPQRTPRSTLIGMPEPVLERPHRSPDIEEDLAAEANDPTRAFEAEHDDLRPMIGADFSGPRLRPKVESRTKLGGFGEHGVGAFGEHGATVEWADDSETEAVDSPEQATDGQRLAGRPDDEIDVATEFAESASVAEGAPADTEDTSVREEEVAPEVERDAVDALLDLPPPAPPAAPASRGPSSARPASADIDEWEDDWAPSLSALGAGQQERPLNETSPESPSARATGDARAQFRLSLPAPPPPPLKRKLPLPRPEKERIDVIEEELTVTDEALADEPTSSANASPAPGTETSLTVEVSPFGAADELSREDLTRPLPPNELARLAAAEEEQERSESELLHDDVTIPLPGLSFDAAAAEANVFSALPDPYTSDTDLTRPLIPLADAEGEGPRSSMLPPLHGMSREEQSSDGMGVPLIVAVPPPTIGTVEQAPSIQITPGAPGSDYTPTSRLPRPFAPTKTSPGGRSGLPPIPKPAPVPAADSGRRGPSHSVAPVTGSVLPPGLASNKRWLLGLAAAVLGVVALGIGLHNRSGSLVVTVAGSSGAVVPGVSVRIDGTERCNTAPCVVKDLKPGMHLVSATASGFQPSADRAVVLEPGEDVAQHIVLSSGDRSTAGLSVAAVGTGLHVTVDGRDVGAPPVTLNDVVPGEHTVRILGDERYYQPYEEVVRLDPGEVRSLGPVRLHILRGKLELRAADSAAGASVAVDGRHVSRLPANIELSADESHEVTAEKAGYREFSQDVVFDGTAERRVTISFGSEASGAAVSPARHALSAAPVAEEAPAPTRSRVSSSTVAVAAPAGTATLDITSTPPAAVVVNGRPLGTTPLHNVHVGAGKQTILFVHPSLGRKLASATVAPGGRASIGVKF